MPRFSSDPTNVFAGLIFGWLGIALLGLIGWIANIVQLVMHMNDPLTTMIVKMVGTLVAPLGAILGYVGMF